MGDKPRSLNPEADDHKTYEPCGIGKSAHAEGTYGKVRILSGRQKISLWNCRSLLITSASVWEGLDKLIDAHVSPTESGIPSTVEIPQSWFDSLTTKDQRKLRNYIHRITRKELGLPTERNQRYTGACYLNPEVH